jgi:hypothetical protein
MTQIDPNVKALLNSLILQAVLPEAKEKEAVLPASKSNPIEEAILRVKNACSGLFAMNEIEEGVLRKELQAMAALASWYREVVLTTMAHISYETIIHDESMCEHQATFVSRVMPNLSKEDLDEIVERSIALKISDACSHAVNSWNKPFIVPMELLPLLVKAHQEGMTSISADMKVVSGSETYNFLVNLRFYLNNSPKDEESSRMLEILKVVLE